MHPVLVIIVAALLFFFVGAPLIDWFWGDAQK